MQNKKTVMAFSALSILIFHLWIYVTHFEFEMYVRELCVIGVDLFFFVSAYSIAKIETSQYKDFLVDRFNKVYLKFIIFSVIGSLYLGFDGIRFMKVILGIELFEKGGGSFLWFLPSIMFVYLILPLYKKVNLKYPKTTFLVVISLYLTISIMISSFTTYRSLFIFTNRIPMILLGYYFAKYNIFSYLNANKFRYWIVTVIACVFGILLSYFVYVSHFRVAWYQDVFYILYIPLGIGLILLLDKIRVNTLGKFIGSSTLELYGLQMIFGFTVANLVFQYTNIKVFSNILTMVILLVMASVMRYIFDLKDKFSIWNK